MEAEDILWVLPYLILAGVMYSIYLWKTARGKSLLAQSRSLIEAGDQRGGIHLLKEALWKANEKPNLEQQILDEFTRIYQSRGISYDNQDYIVLIDQFRELSKKGSTKALDEMKKVQSLKKQLIDRMPDIA